MTTDHLTAAQREAGALFLEGQGWGFGGSVDVAPIDPWNVPGRYGWVGGTGTSAHVTPSTGAVTILLTQVEMAGPTPPALMRDFWRYAADAGCAGLDARPRTPGLNGTPGSGPGVRPAHGISTSSGTCRWANATSISATSSTLIPACPRSRTPACGPRLRGWPRPAHGCRT